MKKARTKKKTVRRISKAKPANKKGGKRASLKKAGQAVGRKVRSTVSKTTALLDDRLTALSPALKTKLEEVKSQIPVGDLRSLGMNVLERARNLSENLRQQKPKSTKAPGGRGRKK